MLHIGFLWYWGQAPSVINNWRDGLRAALETIGKEHDVDWIVGEHIPLDNYDTYLIWGDSNCPAIEATRSYKGKKGLFLTTNPTNIENLKSLDVIFCESQPVYEEVRSAGLHAVKAFGTDSAFFTPDESVKKDIKYLYPATFSPWKRQHILAHLGKDLTCVGTVQPDGHGEFEACKRQGVNIIEGYIPAEELRNLYRRTHEMVIPAVHGSERTVLEAMSMNILPVVAPENKKARSYLKEYSQAPFSSPREFILNQYSPYVYAQSILKGLQ